MNDTKEINEYLNRQSMKAHVFRQSERTRIGELESKAAAYDLIIAAQNAKPWGIDELAAMMNFARGWIHASLTHPGDVWIDEWITYTADIDIHFRTHDDEADMSRFGKIEAWAYHRFERPEIDDRDCTDEVRLI